MVAIDKYCELVQVEFKNWFTKTYENVHTNINVKKGDTGIKKKSNNDTDRYRPDVVILVFDAVSMSNGLRSLQKTLAVLQNNYSAIVYPYLNKIGYNSQPNAHALLSGL